MSKMEQKLLLSMKGMVVGMGNVIATSYGYPRIGLCFGAIALVYLLRALVIRPEKGE